MSTIDRDKFDYVVIGAGSAGCVVANRLSEQADTSVLLLDAGPDPAKGEVDNTIQERVNRPELFQEVQDTDVDWRYWTEPEPYLNGRQLFTPRGKVVGGTSTFIAGLYSRGNPLDFDEWAGLADESWRYTEVLPYFIKLENNRREGISPQFHGKGGPMTVSDLERPNPSTLAFLEACEKLGYDKNTDFNGAKQEGASLWQLYLKDGVRVNSANSYLNEEVRKRPNLQIRTFAHAMRVLIEEGRAVGVEYEDHLSNQKRVAAVREVIVSCGAINSPKLLMLSGIGPAEDLGKYAIPVKVDLPGVGKNLQDHPIIPLVHKYKEGSHSEKPAASGIEGGLFWRSSLKLQSPDQQFVFNHTLLGPPGPLDPMAFMLVTVLIDPRSSGSVSLKSSYHQDPPAIRGNHLKDDADVKVLVNGVRRALEILNAEPFDKFRGEKLFPDQPDKGASDQQIEGYIRKYAGTLFHPVGTCRMGRGPQDPKEMPVVDPALRVFGVKNLRVVDASIMPRITSGNTHTTTVMIGERGADLIKAGAKETK